jgi:hypothetical protein
MLIRVIEVVSDYVIGVVAVLDIALMVAWTFSLAHFIPPGTAVTQATKVFVLAIPLIMFEVLLTGVGVTLAFERALEIRGDTLRTVIAADRTVRDLTTSREFADLRLEIERLRSERDDRGSRRS